MGRRHLFVALLGPALALASCAANAQQFQGQSPSYRSSPNSQSVPARQSMPGTVTTSPPVPIQRTTPPSAASQAPQSAQTAAPSAPSEPRRPQPLASSAASAQAATACMNDKKSASVDTAIQGCDAVISETLKNLANAYYFRGTAKFGKSDFDGAIDDYGQALRLDPSDLTISTAAPLPTKPRRISTARSPITTRPSRPIPIRSMRTTIAAQRFSARATSPAPPPTTVR